jgi:argininosuccinate lyase
VYEALKLENCMGLRASFGGPAEAETARQIRELEAFVAEREA